MNRECCCAKRIQGRYKSRRPRRRGRVTPCVRSLASVLPRMLRMVVFRILRYCGALCKKAELALQRPRARLSKLRLQRIRCAPARAPDVQVSNGKRPTANAHTSRRQRPVHGLCGRPAGLPHVACSLHRSTGDARPGRLHRLKQLGSSSLSQEVAKTPGRPCLGSQIFWSSSDQLLCQSRYAPPGTRNSFDSPLDVCKFGGRCIGQMRGKVSLAALFRSHDGSIT